MEDLNEPLGLCNSHPNSPRSIGYAGEYKKGRRVKRLEKLPSSRELQGVSVEEDDEDDSFTVPQKRLISISELNPIFEELDYSSSTSSATEDPEAGGNSQKATSSPQEKNGKSNPKCKRTSSFRQIWSSLGSTSLPGLPVATATGAKSQESFTSSSGQSDGSKLNGDGGKERKTLKSRLKKVSHQVRKQFSATGDFITDKFTGNSVRREPAIEIDLNSNEVIGEGGDEGIGEKQLVASNNSMNEQIPRVNHRGEDVGPQAETNKETEDLTKPIVHLERFKIKGDAIDGTGLIWNCPNWMGPSVGLDLNVNVLEELIEEEKQKIAQKQPVEWSEAIECLRRSVGRDFRRGYFALGEKMQLPNLQAIRCLKFSPFHSFLAIGCEEGTLIILELDYHKPVHYLPHFSDDGEQTTIGASCRIRMNETLVGHAYDLRCIAWNNTDGKLITSDEIGVIIGWGFSEDGCWVEEIINDRSTSMIRDMAWSPNGKKVVIGYEDYGENGYITGGIIVAYADGSQIYDRKFPDSQVNFVIWHDDSIVWTVVNHVLYSFDEMGELGRVYRPLSMSHSGERVDIVSFMLKPKTSWITSERAPEFAVVYRDSCMGLHGSISDKSPVRVHTQITATCADWSANGLYIVMGGMSIAPVGMVATPQVNLFNYEGKLLQVLKIPEQMVTSVSWDPESLHLTISTERHIYFANLRPMYKVSSSKNTHCYAYTKDCVNQLITFWNHPTTLYTEKLPGKVIDIKCCNDKFAVLLMDSLGVYHVLVFGETGVQQKHMCVITMEPTSLTMTKNCIICLAHNAILNWNFNLDGNGGPETTRKFTGALRTTRQVHVDDFPAIIAKPGEKGEHLNKPTLDSARCMHAVRDQLCVARESGKLQLYALPTLGFLQAFQLDLDGDICQQIMFNNDGTRLALLTMNGRLRICLFPQTTGQQMEIIFCEDLTSISGILWAADMPNHICVMEGSNIHIMQDGQLVEGMTNIPSGCYLANFEELKISLIHMDRVIERPDNPIPSMILHLPTPSYSRMMESLEQDDCIEDIIILFDALPYSHPVLRKLLGNEALRQGNYTVAETIFTEEKNYAGIRFIEKLNEVEGSEIKAAYTFSFLCDHDQAQHYFLLAGRKDLAIKMWKDLGNWEKVTFLSGHNSEDITSEALESQYEVCCAAHDWCNALEIANRLESAEKILHCCLMLEDHEGLMALSERLPLGDPMLSKIGKMLGSDGLIEESVQCFLKCGDPMSAMKMAMDTRNWDLAMNLSFGHSLPFIQPALVKHVRSLLDANRLNAAVQVLDRCGKVITAGKLLVWKGLKLLKMNTENILEVKKIFVLAAKMLSKKSRIKRGSSTQFHCASTSSSAPLKHDAEELDLEFLIPETQLKIMSEHNEWCWTDPWRGAEALHFLNLTQRFIYNGMLGRAFKAAMHLRNFEDILGTERINSLVALTAINNKYHGVASNALLKLEAEDERYSSISFNLFRDYPPVDHDVVRVQCVACRRSIPDFYSTCPFCNTKFTVCIFSASQIVKEKDVWTCQTCQRHVELAKRNRFSYCVLCHTKADY